MADSVEYKYWLGLNSSVDVQLFKYIYIYPTLSICLIQ